MFVEIVLIQRFNLYYGNPIYAASVVISLMLIFSGIGSFFSQKINSNRRTFLKLFPLIIVILIIYAFALTPLLLETITNPVITKILISLLIIAPAAFIMGIPFLSGLRYIHSIKEDLIPWAWGINGCLSVVSTALVVVISVELGFAWVMIFAAAAYG